MRRILVCGSRDWLNRDRILERLSEFVYVSVTLIHGACRGADLLAADVGEQLGFDILPFPAKWREFGKAAGPIRNTQMIVEGRPDLVIAFHADIEHSRGTKNMLSQAIKSNIPTEVISNAKSNG